MRRARRFTLRLDPARDGAVLTLPPGVPAAETRSFLDAQRGWLAATMAKMGAALPVGPGMALPVDGVPRHLETAAVRAPRLVGETLHVPAREPGRAVAAWLKLRARDRVEPMAQAYADALGRRIASVSFRDTRSRWGSCSAGGRLSFSWRIAMAPPEVQRYLAAHEAAHLVEMNHSARYWAVLGGLLADPATPRAWLRREGRALQRYRFEIGATEASPSPADAETQRPPRRLGAS